MPSVLAYHRPTTVEEASALLDGPERRAIGGGTVVVPEARVNRRRGVELVDLQGLGLDEIESAGDRLRIGAMVRVADLAADQRLTEVLRETARRELPSALRNQATVGGTAALAPATSLLFAALLVHDGQLELHNAPPRSLAEGLDRSSTGELILAVSIEAGGRGALATTGRTPADEPIVAAVARHDGIRMRLALTGVAATPVEVDPTDPTDGLTPPADFRGSPDYRLHLAATLSDRAVTEIA